jgi:hypothetical protein
MIYPAKTTPFVGLEDNQNDIFLQNFAEIMGALSEDSLEVVENTKS